MKTKFKLNIVALLAMFLSVALLVACTETDEAGDEAGGVLALAEADTSNYSYSGETLVNKVGADLSVDVAAVAAYGSAVLNVNGVDTTKYHSITRVTSENGDGIVPPISGVNYGTYVVTDDAQLGTADATLADNTATSTAALSELFSTAVTGLAAFTGAVYSLGLNSSYSCDGTPGTGLAASLTCTLTLDADATVADLTSVEVPLALITYEDQDAATAADTGVNAAFALAVDGIAQVANAAALAEAQTDSATAASVQAAGALSARNAIVGYLSALPVPEGAKEFTLTLSAVPFEAGTKADTEEDATEGDDTDGDDTDGDSSTG